MPRKIQEIEERTYSIMEILAFEDELNGRDFLQYCFDSKFIFKHPKYHDHFVNKDTLGAYNNAKELFKALKKYKYEK